MESYEQMLARHARIARVTSWASVILLVLAALCVLATTIDKAYATTPAAERWRANVEAEAATWPAARETVIASLLHQESLWRPDAVSHVGARGMAQFMPGTEADMRARYADLAQGDALQPEWAIRAAVRYLRSNWQSIRPLRSPGRVTPGELSDCDRWAMTLSAYNGGGGWVRRDRRLAIAAGDDPNVWWGQVERHTARADWARRENRAYPHRILRVLVPRYAAAGWPGGVVCDE